MAVITLIAIIFVSLGAQANSIQGVLINEPLVFPSLNQVEFEMQESRGGFVSLYFSEGKAFENQSEFDVHKNFCELKVRLSPEQQKNRIARTFFPKGTQLTTQEDHKLKESKTTHFSYNTRFLHLKNTQAKNPSNFIFWCYGKKLSLADIEKIVGDNLHIQFPQAVDNGATEDNSHNLNAQ